jgi:hypothetical protein
MEVPLDFIRLVIKISIQLAELEWNIGLAQRFKDQAGAGRKLIHSSEPYEYGQRSLRFGITPVEIGGWLNIAREESWQTQRT